MQGKREMIFAPELYLSNSNCLFFNCTYTKPTSPHHLEILVCPSLSWLYFVSCDLFGLTARKSALIWWVSLVVHSVMSGKILLCHVVITEIGAFPIGSTWNIYFSYFGCKSILYVPELRSYWKCTGWWTCHYFSLCFGLIPDALPVLPNHSWSLGTFFI